MFLSVARVELFVILHNQSSLGEIVRFGDAIGDRNRSETDSAFDEVIGEYKFQSLPRSIAAELASLDGAVVLANSGRILAYGAILRPRRAGRMHGTEGSRTKAAIGASHYGLCIKISADGDIVTYHSGEEFLRI
jgi:hypothetical protein